jgi:hypothetical protein
MKRTGGYQNQYAYVNIAERKRETRPWGFCRGPVDIKMTRLTEEEQDQRRKDTITKRSIRPEELRPWDCCFKSWQQEVTKIKREIRTMRLIANLKKEGKPNNEAGVEEWRMSEPQGQRPRIGGYQNQEVRTVRVR